MLAPPMSESVFQEVEEDAEINWRWSLPVRSLHFSKGNSNKALSVYFFLIPSHQKKYEL